MAIPIAWLIPQSFMTGGVISPREWVGTDNWARVLHDPTVTNSIRTRSSTSASRSRWCSRSPSRSRCCSYRHNGRARRPSRQIYLPTLAPMVLLALTWVFVVHFDFGLLNLVLIARHGRACDREPGRRRDRARADAGGPLRRWASGAAAVLGVYGVSLTILGAFEEFDGASVATSFQRGHTAVSAFWGVLGLVTLFVALRRRSSVLRAAGLRALRAEPGEALPLRPRRAELGHPGALVPRRRRRAADRRLHLPAARRRRQRRRPASGPLRRRGACRRSARRCSSGPGKQGSSPWRPRPRRGSPPRRGRGRCPPPRGRIS